jgi:lysophospholipase L1-like esterase
MQETERRDFLRTSLFCASCVFLAHAGFAQDNPSGVSGYNYGRPSFPEGSRLLFQGDSITDMMSILIGVNDVGRACRANKEVDLKQWEADYRFILDASRKANPRLRIILLDPFVLPTGKLRDEAAWKQWNGECTKLRAIVKRLATDYQAAHVRTQEVFDKACEHADPSHWIWDGVHPLPQGHELIARNWIQTVDQQLKD